jgi:hypothetical protein
VLGQFQRIINLDIEVTDGAPVWCGLVGASMGGVSVYAPQLPVIVPKRVTTFRRGLNSYPLSSAFALVPVAGVATDTIRALSRALERK